MVGLSKSKRQLKTLWVPVLLAHVLAGGAVKGTLTENITAHVEEAVTFPNDTFSPEWLAKFNEGDVGCQLARGSYTLQPVGVGSNLNNMFNAWVYALQVKGWTDLALIYAPGFLGRVLCSEESGGLVERGWDCLFGEIPHFCTFESNWTWTQHMVASNVSSEDQREAIRVAPFRAGRHSSKDIPDALKGTGVDHLGALTVVAKILWDHMTPWLQGDIHTVISLNEIFQESPFVAIHVRRGDKLRIEAKLHEAEEYLSEALAYLERNPNSTRVEDIRALWVASDDSGVIDDVRALAPAYFPGVSNESIVYAAQGLPGGPQDTGLVTRTNLQGYGSIVYLFTDFYQLARADVFVCTFSSNVGRLVMLLREGLQKDRTSTISLDRKKWYPGRKQRGLLE